MIWIFRILFVIAFLMILDLLYGIVGLLLTRCRYDKHPKLHRFGLRLLAMSDFFNKRFLHRRCQLDCDNDKCGNWNCPRYCKEKNRPSK
jgi:hypothetical protein